MQVEGLVVQNLLSLKVLGLTGLTLWVGLGASAPKVLGYVAVPDPRWF